MTRPNISEKEALEIAKLKLEYKKLDSNLGKLWRFMQTLPPIILAGGTLYVLLFSNLVNNQIAANTLTSERLQRDILINTSKNDSLNRAALDMKKNNESLLLINENLIKNYRSDSATWSKERESIHNLLAQLGNKGKSESEKYQQLVSEYIRTKTNYDDTIRLMRLDFQALTSGMNSDRRQVESLKENIYYLELQKKELEEKLKKEKP